MRLRTAAALAATTTLFSAGAAAVAAGRYVSGVALEPSPDPPGTGRRLTVHAIGDGRITVSRSLASVRPGVYGLHGDDCRAVVGEVLSTTPDTVTRELERVRYGSMPVGSHVRLTPQLYSGTPGSALGLEYEDVSVPGELGALPAWFVPAARDTWVITVHGLGATREQPFNILPALHRHHFPVLDVTYRNDPGAPESPDGVGHLGDTEWRDLDSAIDYAVGSGAEGVVLYGWSTGATMALRAAGRSALRDEIKGLVLDSPVLDWKSTVRAVAAARGVPRALLPLTVRAAEGRAGLRGEPVAELAADGRLTVPTLVFHGPGDTLAPWAGSRELAALRPDLVTLHTVPDAPHTAAWNVGPAAYEEVLRRFLTPLM